MSDEPTRTGRERSLSDLPTGQFRNPVAWSLVVAGQTDKGRVRPGNEDNFGVESPNSARARAHGTLLIVSDGMGGHAAGEVASALAVETVRDDYYGNTGLPPADAIRHAIHAANSAIFDSAQDHIEQSGMGCTIVVMVVQGHDLTVGHVGDSRGYLIRGGSARQITRDHSWVAMQVEEGVLTPEQAAHHPNRSLLMRALGRQESVEVEIGRHRLQDGDVLIVCSDGLTGVVEDAEIAEYATRLPPAAAVEQLIALANSRGAPDNVTVVAAAIHASGTAAAAGNAPTIVSAPLDSPTPRLGSTTADAPTLRPTPGRSAERPHVTAPLPQLVAPPGTPVVISRESVVTPDTLKLPARRGYGKLVAGAAAAVAVILALAALVYFPNNAPSESARSTEPTAVATVTPASKPTPPQPGAPSLTLAPLPPPAAPVATAPAVATPTAASSVPGGAAAGAATAAAVATRASEAVPGLLPGRAGTPLLPVPGSPAPTSAPTVAAPTPQPSAGDRAAGDQAAPGGDAPAVEETMAPAEPSSAEPAPGEAEPSESAPAPGPPPSGPRIVAPSGGFPAVPGFRPKPRGDDDD